MHRALAFVGQDVERHELETTEGESLTADVLTDEGMFAVTTDDAVDSAVIHHEDGVQVMAVLDSGETSTVYDLAMPEGVELVPSGEGYEFVLEDDAVRVVLGSIEAPWAVDADGQHIPTSYELDGGQLIQHIHGEAAYPVVVDPRLTYGVGVYLNLWGREINFFAGAIVAAGGAAAIATCTTSRIPSQLATLARAACVAVGSPTLGVIYDKIVDMWSTGPVWNWCYQKRIVGGPSASSFVRVNAKNCA